MSNWTRIPAGSSSSSSSADGERLLQNNPRAIHTSNVPVRKRHRDSNSSSFDAGTFSHYSSTDEDEDDLYSEKFSLGAHGARKGSKFRPRRRQKGFLNKVYAVAAHSNDGSSRMWGTTSIRALFVTIGCCIVGFILLWWWVLSVGAFKTMNGPYGFRSEWWGPSPFGGTEKEWEESYKKAAALVEKLSLPAKVNITTGTGWSMGFCVGNTGPALDPKTGKELFPSLCLQDGPLGIRFSDHATAWPAGLTAGATWNRKLLYQRGKLHAREARLKGVNAILGPCMGPLGRMPAGGRNWEGFGSDPVLQGIASAETIKGIQSENVIATAKHYIANEQEHYRQGKEWGISVALSSNIDDRTLHELYMWPFADSVKAGVGSIMCSYQLTNNTYSCGNSKLLNGLLKDELGFQGFVMSDWLAQREGVDSVMAGLDMTMPGDGLFWQDGNSLMGPVLTRGLLNHTIPVSRLNDMVTRIVATYYQLKQDDKELFPSGPNFSSWTDDKIGYIHFGAEEGPKGVVNKYVDVQGKGKDAHGIVVRQIAAEGTVLAKNEGKILPLKRGEWKGKKVGIFGEDAGPGNGPNYCKDRACNQGTLASGWGSGAVEFPYLVTPEEALKRSFNTSKDDLPEFTSILNNYELRTIAKAAEEQDVCLVFINSDSGEGYMDDLGVRGDRNTLYAQKKGDDLVKAVAAVCDNTIVVIHAVGAVIVDRWVDMPGVKAVLYAHLPGQESGNALVDILFGDVNPSGKLPYTVAKTEEDYGENAKILYKYESVPPQQNFTEGLFIDYRYFDKEDITPRYPFGFGLSYTTFKLDSGKIKILKDLTPLPSPRPETPTVQPPSYPTDIPPAKEALFPPGFRKLNRYVYPYLDNAPSSTGPPHPSHTISSDLSPAGGGQGGNPSLWDDLIEVTVTLTNTGSLPGQEVVQLYLSFPSNVEDEGDRIEFPIRVLRQFEKVALDKGESETVKMVLKRRDLSFWSVRKQNWVIPRGEFTVWVGNSSRELPVKVKFEAK